MLLPLADIDQFYEIWLTLLEFINRKTKVLQPSVFKNMINQYNPDAEKEIRRSLWSHPGLIDEFIHANPGYLNLEQLEIVAGWRNFRFGDFTLCKVIRDIGIFLAHDEPQSFYSVYPLVSPFEQLLPEIPTVVRTALIPYKGVIVYDGSIVTYSISFGSGFRRAASDWYLNAYECGLIKTTLPERSLSQQEQIIQRKKANRSVLRYFKIYLRKKSLSDRIINRDINTIEEFSDFVEQKIDETASLRDITMDSFEKFMFSIDDKTHRPTIIGLKRFFTFLQETDRIDWDLAMKILEVLSSY
jgi:hypothetical protein